MTDAAPRPAVIESDLDGIGGSGGAVWSLPHDGDLDANLVRLDPDGHIDEHVNEEVDVMIVVRQGSGVMTIDGHRHGLLPASLVLVPVGRRRSITAGSGGLAYLTVHRRRGPLTISEPR